MHAIAICYWYCYPITVKYQGETKKENVPLVLSLCPIQILEIFLLQCFWVNKHTLCDEKLSLTYFLFSFFHRAPNRTRTDPTYPIAETCPVWDVRLGRLDGVRKRLLSGIVDRDYVTIEQGTISDGVIDVLCISHPSIALPVVRLPAVHRVTFRNNIFTENTGNLKKEEGGGVCFVWEVCERFHNCQWIRHCIIVSHLILFKTIIIKKNANRKAIH